MHPSTEKALELKISKDEKAQELQTKQPFREFAIH